MSRLKQEKPVGWYRWAWAAGEAGQPAYQTWHPVFAIKRVTGTRVPWSAYYLVLVGDKQKGNRRWIGIAKDDFLPRKNGGLDPTRRGENHFRDPAFR